MCQSQLLSDSAGRFRKLSIFNNKANPHTILSEFQLPVLITTYPSAQKFSCMFLLRIPLLTTSGISHQSVRSWPLRCWINSMAVGREAFGFREPSPISSQSSESISVCMSLWKYTHKLGKRTLNPFFCYSGVDNHFCIAVY